MGSQVAWIGLGKMGTAMCRNLAEKGNLSRPLLVFNRNVKRAIDLQQSLDEEKITVCATAEEAVSQSDFIFICVSNDEAVTTIIADVLEKNNHDQTGKIFVDCTTVHPNTTSSLAQQLRRVGFQLVASPVLGMPNLAISGQVVCLLAGPAFAIERIEPFFVGVICRKTIIVSEAEARMASVLKIVANTFLLSMHEALAEGHTLAEKCGLGADKLEQVLAITFPGLHLTNSMMMSSGDYHKNKTPLVSLGLARKDARHALQLASEFGVDMGALNVVDTHMEIAGKYAGPEASVAGIFGAVRQNSGLQYEN